MKLSKFGQKFTGHCGIFQLMEDLSSVVKDDSVIMLGGGNPGYIPEAMEAYRASLQNIANSPTSFARVFGNYSAPCGEQPFIDALVNLLNERFHWGLTAENIALTNGSQNGFFALFNLFAGEMSDGSQRKILLPLAPEYIGYEDVSIDQPFFKSYQPVIEQLDARLFKYGVDFAHLEVGDDIGAICVSRPTNPTGNVLTDEEMTKLAAIARENDIPFIVDNAYGAPFPDIIESEATPHWDDNMVMCMSLSKLGLPAVRTGIIIAREEIISAVSGLNAITNLSPTGIGASLMTPLVENGDILRISKDIVRPFYRQKAAHALACIERYAEDLPLKVHKPEGAIFLWQWIPDLPIHVQTLYERLKARGVVIVPGHYFFPGLEGDWRHRQECFRMTYTQSDDAIERGVKIICEEIRRAFAEAA